MRLFIVLAFVLCATAAAADTTFWMAAREDGVHLLMRHARAPGTGDPPGFRLDDCATQRVLDDRGRDQARRIGAAIRAAGIPVTAVLSSAWCRARETADLMGLAPVRHEPALDSFFQDRSVADDRTRALTRALASLSDRKAVLVTHQVNITALTGVFPASGELVAVSLDGGRVTVRGRLAVD